MAPCFGNDLDRVSAARWLSCLSQFNSVPETSLGVQLRQGPSDKNHAIAQFEEVFRDKTGRSWEERGSPMRQAGKYEVKEYYMSTSAAAFSVQAPQPSAHQVAAIGGMDRVEFTALDPLAKLLVMLASMGRKGLLTTEQKSHLKFKILNEQSPILYNALEAYERDNNESELADTFARVLAFEKGERLNDQFVPARPVPLASVQRNLTSQFGSVDSYQGFGSKTEPAPPKLAASQSSTGGITATLTDPSWRALLEPEFSKPYFKKLEKFVEKQYSSKEVFPPKELIFNAFNLCPLDKIKVVILGQDPYHDNGQAHGLCFSVMRGVPVPPSLKNIYKYVPVCALIRSTMLTHFSGNSRRTSVSNHQSTATWRAGPNKVFCFSTPSWPSRHTRPTRTRRKAGRL